MNLQLPGSVRTGRLAASLAASMLLVAALLPTAALAANGGATKLAISATSLVGNATAGVSFTLTVAARDNADAVTTGFTDAVASPRATRRRSSPQAAPIRISPATTAARSSR